jgi:hypothetical protein
MLLSVSVAEFHNHAPNSKNLLLHIQNDRNLLSMGGTVPVDDSFGDCLNRGLRRLNLGISITNLGTIVRICTCYSRKLQTLSRFLRLLHAALEWKSSRVDNFDCVKSFADVALEAALKVNVWVTGDCYSACLVNEFDCIEGA